MMQHRFMGVTLQMFLAIIYILHYALTLGALWSLYIKMSSVGLLPTMVTKWSVFG